MNWGSPLLLGWLSDLWANLQDGFSDMVYSIANAILDLLYLIWKLLAGIINGIESIFRNLAGLGTDGKDMVSSIINNSAVQTIFKNLVGFATALIIFFTIVKVLQEHYKEKDGGNPYKIVIRTFKGLLMFFFVGTAVTVGLYATGVIFRGIDAATGGGNVSLSAQVFKSMAYEANRVRQGRDEDGGLFARAKNKRWSRMSADGGVEYGKYALVKMTDKTPNTTADVRAAYQKLCPEYNYGIVDANGIVSPIAPFLNSLINEQKTAQTADEETDSEKTNEYLENLKQWYGNGGITKNEGNFDNGSGSAAFGYQNDILSALTLKIQPTINLDWSPVDIVDYYYEIMNDGEPVTWDVNITFMGTGVNISFAKEYVKYVYKGHDKKSLEDSAKSFGISLSGKTALQDGELSASFNLDMFDVSRFQDILTSVVVNVLYTNLTKMIIEALPTMPGSYSVSGVKINLVQLLAPLIFNTLESVVNSSMIGLLPTAKDANGEVLKDEDGNEILAVEPFVIDGRNHNGGVWVNVNTKSEKMPVTIERYQVDGNFSELWSQLTDNWDKFTEEMEKAADQTWEVYEENEDLLERDIQKIEDQKDWLNYRDMVDLYNRDTIEYLTQIGNLLGMYDQAYKMADNRVDQIDIQLQRMGYAGTASDLEDEVKEIFVKMVAFYNAFKDTEPSKDVADAIYTSSIYKPIITFPYRDKYAQSMSFADIKAALTGNNKDKIVVNMLLNEDDGYAYRLIDWNSYGYVYEQEFNKHSFVADLYSDPSYEVTEPANEANEKSYGKTLDQLKFRRLTDDSQEETLETQWNTQGLSYFLNAEGENNPFVKQTPRGGMKSVLYDNSYWGNRGVTVDGVRYYCYYNGEMVGIDLRNKGLGAKESTTASTQTATVYSSSARKNALAATRKNETLKELQSMMEVSTEKNPLAEEFAKNIITFRKLGTASSTTDTDKKALRSWVRNGSIAAPIGAHEVYMVPSMTADQIDALMAGGDGQRHYLMLTEEGMSTPDANGEFKSFAGMFSYTSATTVSQLYDMGSMNFAIGFIAIIAAAGVYMNFAFGLIQRAVTMAVLYIMSPITISFYPFDDGSKFNQQFVSPFYKEAISAFAVIVSLNIFVLLLEPVQTTVVEVTGSTVLGWIGLVAFVTMLPKIRDTITSVLGAGGLAQKGLGQIFSDANKALGSEGRKKFKNNVANGLAKVRDARDRMITHKQDNEAKEQKKLEKKLEDGKKLTAWEQHRLNKLKNKGEKKKSRDEKMQDALESGNTDGLNWFQKRRYDKIQEKAEKKNGGAFANDEARKNFFTENKDFKKSVGAVAMVKKGINKGINKAGKGLKFVGSKFSEAGEAIAQSKFGKTISKAGEAISQSKLGKAYSAVKGATEFAAGALKSGAGKVVGPNGLLGEMVKAKYGINGTATEDKNSLWGELNRWRNPVVRGDNRKKIEAKEVAYANAEKEYLSGLASGIEAQTRKETEGDKKVTEAARIEYAKQIVEGNKNTKDKLVDLLVADEVAKAKAEGKAANFGDIKKKATADAETYIQTVGLEQAYANFGGDQKYINGLASGAKEFEGLSIPLINFDDENAKKSLSLIEHELRKKLEGGTISIKAELDSAMQTQDATVTTLKESLIKTLDIDNDNDKKALEKILEDNRDNPSITYDKMVDLIVDRFGSDKRTAVEQGMDAKAFAGLQSSDIAELKALLAASQAYDKGQEMFNGKIGNFVSEADKQAILDAFKNARDTNLASTNKDSIGYRIQHEVNNKQWDSEADKAAAKRKIEVEVKNKAEKQLDHFRNKYADDMREYSIAKKYKEEMSAVEPMAFVTELQNQREFHMNVKMEMADTQLIINDGLIQKMHADGNYAEAGFKLQQLVDAIKQHDYEAAKKLKFDEATIEKLTQLERQGELKRLDSIHELGEFDAAYMGSMANNMGGSSMAGWETAFAQLTRVAETKTITEKFKTAAADFAQREAHNRAVVEQTLKKIETTVGGDLWEGLASTMGLGDAAGLIQKLQSDMSGVNAGTKSKQDVADTINALIKFKNDNIETEAIANSVDMILHAFSSAELANEQCAQTNLLRGKVSDLEALLHDIMKKLKSFSK